MPRRRRPAIIPAPAWRTTHYVELTRTGARKPVRLELMEREGVLVSAAGATWFHRVAGVWVYAGRDETVEARVIERTGPRPRRGEVAVSTSLRATPTEIAAFQRAAGGGSWREWLLKQGRKAAGIA